MHQASRWIRAMAFLPLAASLGCTTPAPKGGVAASQPSTFSKIGDSFTSMGNTIAAPFKAKDKKPPETQVSANDPTSLDKKPALSGAEYQVSVATMQESSGNIEGEVKAYEKALEIDPKYLPALIGLGKVYDRQEKYDRAISYYQRAVNASPKSAAAHNALGLCYSRKGQHDEALAELKKAVALAPQNAGCRNNLATELVALNKPDEAFAQLREVHTEADSHYNLGVLLAQRGDNAKASEHFAMALAREPQMKDAQVWLAQINRAPNATVAEHSPATSGPRLPFESNLSTALPAEVHPAGNRSISHGNQVAVRDLTADTQVLMPLPPIDRELAAITVTPINDENDIRPLPPVETSHRVNAQPAAFPLTTNAKSSSFDIREEDKPQSTKPRNELKLLPAE